MTSTAPPSPCHTAQTDPPEIQEGKNAAVDGAFCQQIGAGRGLGVEEGLQRRRISGGNAFGQNSAGAHSVLGDGVRSVPLCR
jgi:hypothetical protein